MAEIKDSTAKTKPRSSRFLGCFGFSKKVPEKKMYRDAVKSGCRKKTRWLSWSRFRTKKSVVKTVPVDTTVRENPYRSRETHMLKSDEIVPAAAPVKTVIDKPHKRRYENAQNIVLESRESLDSVKEDTCQRGLPSTRKKEAKRSGVSHPSSPENRSKSGVTNKVLSHSVSFPMPKSKNQAAATGDGDSRVKEDKTHQESDIFAGKLDQVVGMSIIMVTLIIMVIWGKLCAILCTSAWFYFVPRLRNSVKSNVSVKNELNSGDFDMNSEEYKKKVVLEGLLRRSHRSFVGFL